MSVGPKGPQVADNQKLLSRVQVDDWVSDNVHLIFNSQHEAFGTFEDAEGTIAVDCSASFSTCFDFVLFGYKFFPLKVGERSLGPVVVDHLGNCERARRGLRSHGTQTLLASFLDHREVD